MNWTANSIICRSRALNLRLYSHETRAFCANLCRRVQSSTLCAGPGSDLRDSPRGTASRRKNEPLDVVHLSTDRGFGTEPGLDRIRNLLARRGSSLFAASRSGSAIAGL